MKFDMLYLIQLVSIFSIATYIYALKAMFIRIRGNLIKSFLII
ncbi:hypothetical protein [Clostridium tertium]|nr:hypothetical protein [Clostridium tertium]